MFSVSDLPIPASISTPTFDSELGIEVDTATVIPEIPHSFYLMEFPNIYFLFLSHREEVIIDT